jgi:hypothetical protein
MISSMQICYWPVTTALFHVTAGVLLAYVKSLSIKKILFSQDGRKQNI